MVRAVVEAPWTLFARIKVAMKLAIRP